MSDLPASGQFFTDRIEFGLTAEALQIGLANTYKILETIDRTAGIRLAKIVELANLSAMLGNILASQIVAASNGVFGRAGAHKYQDLRSMTPSAEDIEIKVALEGNKPKGHLPKTGHYLTCRYVLCNDAAELVPGDRGSVVRIWEMRLGELEAAHFNLSNTEGDSGKTAVVNKNGMIALKLIYFDPERCPLNVKRFRATY